MPLGLVEKNHMSISRHIIMLSRSSRACERGRGFSEPNIVQHLRSEHRQQRKEFQGYKTPGTFRPRIPTRASDVDLRSLYKTRTPSSSFLCVVFPCTQSYQQRGQQLPHSCLTDAQWDPSYKSLASLDLWFIHQMTEVRMLTRYMLSQGIPYEDRGWPQWEYAVANLTSIGGCELDWHRRFSSYSHKRWTETETATMASVAISCEPKRHYRRRSPGGRAVPSHN